MKRLLNLFLLLTMFVVNAMAVDYPIEVGGVKITSSNANDVLGDGTVMYNDATKTLTLKNANLSGVSDVICDYDYYETITINLIGKNTVKADYDALSSDGASYIITGDGTLNVNGIYLDEGSLTIKDNATVNVLKSDSYAVSLKGGNLSVFDKAYLKVEGNGKDYTFWGIGGLSLGSGISIQTAGISYSSSQKNFVDAKGNITDGEVLIGNPTKIPPFVNEPEFELRAIDNQITAIWKAATDTKTSAANLKYNVYASISTGSLNIDMSQKHPINGNTPIRGNGETLSYTFDKYMVSGTTHDLSPEKYYCVCIEVIDEDGNSAEYATQWVKTADKYYRVELHGQAYYYLEDAIDKANENDEIKLHTAYYSRKTVRIGKSVTIDLCGHEINIQDDDVSLVLGVYESANVTLKNGQVSVIGGGKPMLNYDKACGVAVYPNSKLTMENIIIGAPYSLISYGDVHMEDCIMHSTSIFEEGSQLDAHNLRVECNDCAAFKATKASLKLTGNLNLKDNGNSADALIDLEQSTLYIDGDDWSKSQIECKEMAIQANSSSVTLHNLSVRSDDRCLRLIGQNSYADIDALMLSRKWSVISDNGNNTTIIVRSSDRNHHVYTSQGEFPVFFILGNNPSVEMEGVHATSINVDTNLDQDVLYQLNGTATLKDVYFAGDTKRQVYCGELCEMHIENSTISSSSTIESAVAMEIVGSVEMNRVEVSEYNGNDGIIVRNRGKLLIKESEGDKQSIGAAGTALTVTGNGNVTIESGMVRGNEKCIRVEDNGIVNIKDGSFAGLLEQVGDGKLTIEGGRYTHSPEVYLASNYVVNENTNEFYKYQVVERTTSIQKLTSTTADAPAYDLMGRKVNGNYRGIVIKDGKKVMVK